MTKPALTLVEPDKSTLEMTAEERAESFRLAVFRYKSKRKMTYEEIAKKCDITPNLIPRFFQGGGITLNTALKISMGLGIEF